MNCTTNHGIQEQQCSRAIDLRYLHPHHRGHSCVARGNGISRVDHAFEEQVCGAVRTDATDMESYIT